MSELLPRHIQWSVDRNPLANITWSILITWQNHCTLFISVWRIGLTFKALWILQLRNLSQGVALRTFRYNLMSDVVLEVALSRSFPDINDQMRNRTNRKLTGIWKHPFSDHKTMSSRHSVFVSPICELTLLFCFRH